MLEFHFFISVFSRCCFIVFWLAYFLRSVLQFLSVSVPLCLNSHQSLPLVALNIFSICFVFNRLTTIYLGIFFLIFLGVLGILGSVPYCLSLILENSQSLFFKYFSFPILPLLGFWWHMICDHMLSQSSLHILFGFGYFFLMCFSLKSFCCHYL